MSRLTAGLLALGLVGVASLLLVPLEQLIAAPLSPIVLRLLALLQPALLVALATALGAWLAPRIGLDAPLSRAWTERGDWRGVLRRQLPAAAVAGVIGAATLVAYSALWNAAVGDAAAGAPLAGFDVPLATKLLYGGLAEELMLRWGVMSLIIWAASLLARRAAAPPDWCYWSGAAGAALLFALGHLPLLFVLMPSPPIWLLGAVLFGNALPGLLFGWLFWRKGLEAAMIAHALAHLIATGFLAL